MNIPTWLLEVHPNSALNTRDVAALLNINVRALRTRCNVGTFPKCDFKAPGFNRVEGRNNAKNEWRVRTVINWIKAQT